MKPIVIWSTFVLTCVNAQVDYDANINGPSPFDPNDFDRNNPLIPRDAKRERMIKHNDLKRPGIEVYGGAGHAMPFSFVQNLNTLPCDETQHQSLRVQQWWDDYFRVHAINHSNYVDLYRLVKRESSNFDLYKTGMANICLFGYRLLHCDQGSCVCRGNQTTSHNVSAYGLGRVTHVECLIRAGQPCARRTVPGNYELYKKTRRRCEPGLCCHYKENNGSSSCEACRGRSTATRKNQEPLKFSWILIASLIFEQFV